MTTLDAWETRLPQTEAGRQLSDRATGFWWQPNPLAGANAMQSAEIEVREAVLAIEDQAIAAAREPMDAAWREAEALAGSGLTLEYVVYPVVVEVGEPRIDPYRVKSGDHYAWGPTPAAALRALAEALRKPVPA